MSRRWVVPALLSVAAVVWAVTVVAAYRAMRVFESTPGRSAIAPLSWPEESVVRRSAGTWTLVMLVHPHCSCSRASVKELEAVLEKAPRHLQPHVLVYRPHEYAPGWERTDVYASAQRLRRATVLVDKDGRDAKLFGGFTSGQTFLYDPDGRLRFEGGITSLRGHEGLNSGRVEIIRIAQTQAGSATHPVFGCAITTEDKGVTK